MCYVVDILHKTRKGKHQNSYCLFSNCSFLAICIITAFLYHLIIVVLKNDLSFDPCMQFYLIHHFNHKNCRSVEMFLL